MKILLRPLQAKETDEVYEMFRQIPAEENGFHNSAFHLSRQEFDGFTTEKQMPPIGEGMVPQTYYVLFVEDVCVGFGKLRHYLNEKLLERGGHIGYGIAPKFRGHGYGNILLAEILKKAKAMNIEKVLLTCNADNLSSCKTIERNGGILEKTIAESNYYWIDI